MAHRQKGERFNTVVELQDRTKGNMKVERRQATRYIHFGYVLFWLQFSPSC